MFTRDETPGIDHNTPPRSVGVKTQGEDRQARLGRDHNKINRFKALSPYRFNGLACHKTRGKFPELYAFAIIKHVKHGDNAERRYPIGFTD